jgi:hypothetical protein
MIVAMAVSSYHFNPDLLSKAPEKLRNGDHLP